MIDWLRSISILGGSITPRMIRSIGNKWADCVVDLNLTGVGVEC
jgi:hypothetical protein